MWIFNGETKTKFQPYRDAIIAVLEEQNGEGAHMRHHAALDIQTTADVQYAPAAHYVSAMKKAWRYNLLHLYSLFEEHANSDSDDLMPCLQPLEALRILSCDGKTSVPAGRTTPILETANQLACVLVSSASRRSSQAADHDWHSKAKTVT
eukprot:14387656-Ditylum_brightwellii.AAC.1